MSSVVATAAATPDSPPVPPLHYLWAALISGAALAVRLLLDPVLGTSARFSIFILAVAVSATLGRGPGLLSAAVGGLSILLFVVPPIYKPWLIDGLDNQLGFALYLAISGVIVALSEFQRRAKSRAEREMIERLRVEAREAAERQRFDVVLASIADGVISTDCADRITFINRIASELTGWPQSDALGRPIAEVFCVEEEESHVALESPTTLAPAHHLALITRSGRRIPIGHSGAPVIDATGQIVGAVLVFRDISELRRRDQEVHQLKQMIELSQDAVTVTDRERRIQSWNLGAREMYGWEAAETHGRLIHALLGTSAADLEKKEHSLRQDGCWEGELTHVHKDGRPILCESRQVILLNGEHQIQGMLEINRDITQRRRIEEKLRETAKLESLGVLAGGIAHDFNNLLTGVLGNASMLLDDAPLGSPVWTFANGICEAAEQAAKLAHQMLAYSGRGHFVITHVDLSHEIRRNTALLQSSVPKNVEVRFEFADDVPEVAVDVTQLRQLILNLVVNGAEAIGTERGCVTVSTRRQIVDDAYRRALHHCYEHIELGLYVLLEISDSGCGMDEQTLSRILDPFFTTKFVGRGLGLPAAQGIVRGHQAAMRVESQLGRGSCFSILFPACSSAAPAHIPRPVEVHIGSHTPGVILVVDDEPVVRSTAERALSRLGIRRGDGRRRSPGPRRPAPVRRLDSAGAPRSQHAAHGRRRRAERDPQTQTGPARCAVFRLQPGGSAPPFRGEQRSRSVTKAVHRESAGHARQGGDGPSRNR
jgi:PAS domain S-box-containing protein